MQKTKTETGETSGTGSGAHRRSLHPQTARFLGAVCEAAPPLSAEKMQRWIEKPKELQFALARALTGGFGPEQFVLTFGTENLSSLRDKLMRHPFVATSLALAMTQMLQVPGLPKATLTLTSKTPMDLKFSGKCTYDELLVAAGQFGYGKCGDVVGPLLRVIYTEQPWGECLLVAMDPIATTEGPMVFGLENEEGRLLLTARHASENRICEPNERFLFF